jgi:hypothetical protein
MEPVVLMSKEVDGLRYEVVVEAVDPEVFLIKDTAVVGLQLPVHVFVAPVESS